MENDGIQYRIATPADEDIFRDMYFKDLFERDVIAKGLKTESPRESRAFVDIAVPQVCKSGLSILAIDKSTNQVVGFRATIMATRDNPQDFSFPPDDENCRKLLLMFGLASKLKDNINFFEEYGADKIAFFRGLVVKSEYSRRGIALKMVQKSLDAAMAEGCRLVVAESSSFYSQRVFEKAGFKTIKILPYKDYCIEGKQLISGEGEHTEMRLHVKEL